jgi:DNA-binding beta-propeller fold protein YncE
MQWVFAALAILLGACAQPAGAPTGGPTPVLKRAIPLAGVSGRIDHLAYEAGTQRLFVAALENGSLEVVDLERGERIRSIGGLSEPQGVACVPETKQVVVACGGDGTAREFDARTFEERVTVAVGEDADNVRLSPDGKSIIVGYGSGALAFLESATLRKTGEIKLSGHPESFQVDPDTHRVFANVPGGFVGGGGAVAVADLSTQKVIATWTLKEAGRNFPMALDAAHQRLYVGCRRSAKLLAIDTDSGRVMASPECVGDADDVFVDAKTGRVVVIGGDGAVDVFEAKDGQGCVKAASVRTESGARTGLLVPERHALYVAVPKQGGHQAEIREYALPD